MQGTLQRYCDVAANLATTALCVGILVSLIQHHGTSDYADRGGSKPALVVGAPFPELPGASYGRHRLTLAVFLNTRCIACQESVPDYDMFHKAVANSNGIQFVGVFKRESSQAIADFGFRSQAVQVQDFGPFRVSGTPTTVLIGNNGKIIDFWIGRLPAKASEKILQRIKGGVGW